LFRTIDNYPDHARWVDWLFRGCGMPIAHIAIVLDLDPRAIDAWIRRPYKWGRRRAVPAGPRRRGRAVILGPTAGKVARLRELKYSAAKIARLLCLDLADVKEFIARIKPIRRAALARPRERAQQAALRPCRRRRRKHPAPMIADPWRCPGDAALDRQATAIMPAIAAEARELVDHQAGAELPAAEPVAPPPAAWSGPLNPNATKAPKLTPDQMREVAELRSLGRSEYDLARSFGVARNTIRRAAPCLARNR